MKLDISTDLALPLDDVTQKNAFLGSTGSGKTYGATKLAELMLEARAQIVVLDPVGPWGRGLRANADGKGAGFPIPIFGGMQGDIPLEPTSGKLVADVIVDQTLSVVLDVSQFETDSAKARFASDFAERFFFRKKASPSAVHIFLEECQEFIPQNPMGDGENLMLNRWTRIWKLGRNYGIGGSLISQRPQEVSKRALNLSELVFAFKLTGPQERAALAKWTAEHGVNEDINALLPKLQVGYCRAWSPSWLGISKTIKIAPKTTFDSSATPKVGEKARQPKGLTDIDLGALTERMAATIERAKADDPKELQKTIADLKRQLLKANTPAVAPAPTGKEIQDAYERGLQAAKLEFGKSLLGWHKWFNDRMTKALSLVSDAGLDLKSLGDYMAEPPPDFKSLDQLISDSQAHATASRAPASVMRQVPAPTRAVQKPPSTPAAARPAGGSGDATVGGGELKILTAAIQFNGIERDELGILIGLKRSSRDAYVSRLAAKGLVEINGKMITPTAAGHAAAPNAEPLPVGRDLFDYWMGELGGGERELLGVLHGQGNEWVKRDDLDIGLKRSSRDAYLSRLASRRLIESKPGQVKAADILFG